MITFDEVLSCSWVGCIGQFRICMLCAEQHSVSALLVVNVYSSFITADICLAVQNPCIPVFEATLPPRSFGSNTVRTARPNAPIHSTTSQLHMT